MKNKEVEAQTSSNPELTDLPVGMTLGPKVKEPSEKQVGKRLRRIAVHLPEIDKEFVLRVANPLKPIIDKDQKKTDSVTELIVNAIRKIDSEDLPEDPRILKEILNDAVDHAVSLKERK